MNSLKRMGQKANTEIQPVRVFCEGGGLGAGWVTEVTWVPTGGGYEMFIDGDPVTDTPNAQQKRTSKGLTFKAVVEDCLRYPEARVYGDFYDVVSIEGLPPAQADVVKLAIVEDEDQPVPSSLIDYFVAQPTVTLESLRRAFGPLWQARARNMAGQLCAWQEQLGLPIDISAAGKKVGWEESQRISTLKRLLRLAWGSNGFAVVARTMTNKGALARFWALEPRPMPNTAHEWAVLLKCAIGEQIFEEDRGATTVPAMEFLQWLVDAVPVKHLKQLKCDHPVPLERFSGAARSYLQQIHDPNAPAPGGFTMGRGHVVKAQRDKIYAALTTGLWAQKER